MPPLDLSISATTGQTFIPLLRRHIPAAHKLLKSPLREFSVALVGEQRMTQLHQRFMNIASPTDVLSFSLESDRRGRTIGGEVVVCVPVARRRAREMGLHPGHEVLLYALHGLLHLSGWDDRTDRQYRQMHEMEDRLLQQLGLAPVFRPKPLKGRP